jgi:hypothetical protein
MDDASYKCSFNSVTNQLAINNWPMLLSELFLNFYFIAGSISASGIQNGEVSQKVTISSRSSASNYLHCRRISLL